MTIKQSRRGRTALVVGLAIVVVALIGWVADQAFQVLSYDRAEAACVRVLPSGSTEYSVQWQHFPAPHWVCAYDDEGGLVSRDLGLWPNVEE